MDCHFVCDNEYMECVVHSTCSVFHLLHYSSRLDYITLHYFLADSGLLLLDFSVSSYGQLWNCIKPNAWWVLYGQSPTLIFCSLTHLHIEWVYS